jgi:hypothetical protein
MRSVSDTEKERGSGATNENTPGRQVHSTPPVTNDPTFFAIVLARLGEPRTAARHSRGTRHIGTGESERPADRRVPAGPDIDTMLRGPSFERRVLRPRAAPTQFA